MEGIKTGNFSASTLARACGDTKQMAKVAQNFFEREATGQLADMSVSQARYLLKTGEQAYKATRGTIRLGNAELLKLLDNFADDIAADIAAETLAAQLGRTRTMEAIESVLDKTTFEAIKDTIEGRGLEQAEPEKLNQVIRGYSLQKGEQMSTTQIRGLLKDGGWLTKSVDDVVAEPVKRGTDNPHLITNKFPLEQMPNDGIILSYYIEDGKIKGINGQTKIDFVINADGELILGKKHHLLGGAKDVKAAGQLKLNGKGAIKRIDNLSGHYRPTVEEAMATPQLFRNLGLDLDKTWLEFYDIKIDSLGYIEETEKVYVKMLKGD